MEIVFRKLKLPHTIICNSLIACDMKVLTFGVLELLDGIIPNDEEVKLLKQYTEDRLLLATPE